MSDGPDPRRWRALAVCLAAGFMALLDVSIVNVALPSIRSGLDAPTSALQWVVSGYALTFGLLLVPAGRLGDQRGRRTMFVVGVGIFTLSSLAAGLATSPAWLVAARCAQGIGGGVLNPQISALIQELFRGRERGRAFGFLGTTIGVATAVGPIAGGLLIQVFGTDDGWRWIFFVNLPIGAITIGLALRLLPVAPSSVPRGVRDLDPFGVLLLGAGIFAVLFPLVEAQQPDGGPGWWLAVLGGVVLLGFMLWERRFATRGYPPLVDLSLFSLRSYSAGLGLAVAYFSGFTGIFFILTLFLQGGAGYSALEAGLSLTPFALASAIGAMIAGRLVSRLGRRLVVAGLGGVVCGVVVTDVVVGLVGADAAIGWWMAAPLALAGFGSGMVISPNITLTLADVPVERAGTAGGVLQTGQRIGTAAGIALIGSIFFSSLASDGDYAHAAGLGLRTIAALTAVALALGIAYVTVGSHSRAGVRTQR